jgi:uncharacterized protein YuzE
MTERGLQITYRKGRPFAAYLYLSRVTGERSARTEASADGLLIVDFAADGRPIGIEITGPGAVTLDRINDILRKLDQAPLPEVEFDPLRAA